MMKTVILYGELAKRFGKTHRLAVRSAGEAVRALRANFPALERFLLEAHPDSMRFRVFVGREALSGPQELLNPAGEAEVIRIVPILHGAGNGWVKTIIGATLVVAGIIVTGASFGGASALGAALASAGVGLIIGGVSQLLTKPPEIPQQEDRKTSYLFGGPENTSAQGRAVPVGYGRMIVGSAVISAGIETHELPV